MYLSVGPCVHSGLAIVSHLMESYKLSVKIQFHISSEWEQARGTEHRVKNSKVKHGKQV